MKFKPQIVFYVLVVAFIGYLAFKASNLQMPKSASAASDSPTMTTPALPPVQVGRATNLHGTIRLSDEQPVYADAVVLPRTDLHSDNPVNAPLPQRIWTLLPGSSVTAICQSTDPALEYGGAGLYVTWAPGKFGYIESPSLTITDRTANTNEAIDITALKGC